MGLISEYIEKKLDSDARERGLLVWLDRNGDYCALAERLEGKSRTTHGAIQVYCYRGSFLDVMARSQEALGGKSKPRCVIHVPGMDEENIKATPLYEMYCAGQRWRVALETAVRECAVGRLSTEQVEHLLSDGPLTLDQAEEAFEGLSDAPQEIRPLLTRFGETGLVAAFLKDAQDVRDALGVDRAVSTGLLLDYFSRYLGMFEGWYRQWPGWDTEKVEELADLVAAWMLCVEYTGDLTVSPPGERLQQLVSTGAVYRKRIGQCLQVLRQSEPDLYIKFSLRIQDSLKPEEQALDYRCLGQLDTFRFEADLFLQAALDLLARNAWSEAHDIARTRLPGRRGEDLSRTFWLVNDRERQWLWDWIDAAALLGMSLQEGSANVPDTPAAWLDAYTLRWWKVDQYHRRFALQTDRFVAGSTALGTREFFLVKKTLGSLYREHVERLGRGWNELCERDGFTWNGLRRQRDFYRDWMSPALRAGQKTAVILADALRYELGKELESLVADASWKSCLTSWMLAELPTITAVGMNVLFAPPASGSLRPLFSARGLVRGMQVGHRQVDGQASRLALIKETSNADCAWSSLEELIKADEREFRRLSGHAVLVVASREIDEMGENDVRKFGFDAFQHVLASIKQAVLRLRDGGFERIVITADHGFLLGDEFMENGYGARLDAPDRRYAVGTARSGDDLVSVPFQRLGYEATAEATEANAFIFGRGTGCLTNVGATGFYHGGTSLQEMVVPVLDLVSPRYAKQGGLSYRLRMETLKPVLGYQRIRLGAESRELFAAEALEVRLAADEGIEVVVADAGEARITGSLIRLAIGEPVEILFTLRGPASRSRLRVLPVQPGLVLDGDVPDSYFSCVQDSGGGVQVGTGAASSEEPGTDPRRTPDAETSATHSSSFHASIPDAFHAALAHLGRHGSLTEAFLVNSLGGGPAGARKARRFASEVQSWDTVLPFRITLESSAEGKIYKVIQD